MKYFNFKIENALSCIKFLQIIMKYFNFKIENALSCIKFLQNLDNNLNIEQICNILYDLDRESLIINSLPYIGGIYVAEDYNPVICEVEQLLYGKDIKEKVQKSNTENLSDYIKETLREIYYSKNKKIYEEIKIPNSIIYIKNIPGIDIKDIERSLNEEFTFLTLKCPSFKWDVLNKVTLEQFFWYSYSGSNYYFYNIK